MPALRQEEEETADIDDIPKLQTGDTKDTGDGEHVYVSPRVGPARLSDKLLQLQEKMNVALE